MSCSPTTINLLLLIAANLLIISHHVEARKHLEDEDGDGLREAGPPRRQPKLFGTSLALHHNVNDGGRESHSSRARHSHGDDRREMMGSFSGTDNNHHQEGGNSCSQYERIRCCFVIIPIHSGNSSSLMFRGGKDEEKKRVCPAKLKRKCCSETRNAKNNSLELQDRTLNFLEIFDCLVGLVFDKGFPPACCRVPFLRRARRCQKPKRTTTRKPPTPMNTTTRRQRPTSTRRPPRPPATSTSTTTSTTSSPSELPTSSTTSTTSSTTSTTTTTTPTSTPTAPAT